MTSGVFMQDSPRIFDSCHVDERPRNSSLLSSNLLKFPSINMTAGHARGSPGCATMGARQGPCARGTIFLLE